MAASVLRAAAGEVDAHNLAAGLNFLDVTILGMQSKTTVLPIASLENDSSEFIELVSQIVGQVIREFHSKEVFLIRTDQWFDSKWLAFSGKMLGAVGVSSRRLTLPPFVPNRVLSQLTYSFTDETASYQKTQISPLHLVQPSRQNLTRFIDRISKSGVFVWFSGDTQQNLNGSLMIYTITDVLQSAWYASFQKTNTWQINKVCGLSKNELLHFMSAVIQ